MAHVSARDTYSMLCTPWGGTIRTVVRASTCSTTVDAIVHATCGQANGGKPGPRGAHVVTWPVPVLFFSISPRQSFQVHECVLREVQCCRGSAARVLMLGWTLRMLLCRLIMAANRTVRTV
jgi:hypothetical protein